MGGGSDLTLAAPFPDDPLDPVDPLMSSKIAVVIVRVVSLDQNRALALCFFDFLRTSRTKHLLLRQFSAKNPAPSRMGSRKISLGRAGDGSAQNFAGYLLEVVKSFFGKLNSKKKSKQ